MQNTAKAYIAAEKAHDNAYYAAKIVDCIMATYFERAEPSVDVIYSIKAGYYSIQALLAAVRDYLDRAIAYERAADGDKELLQNICSDDMQMLCGDDTADICLRQLPQIYKQLDEIDPGSIAKS